MIKNNKFNSEYCKIVLPSEGIKVREILTDNIIKYCGKELRPSHIISQRILDIITISAIEYSKES